MKNMKKGIATLAVLMAMGTLAFGQDVTGATDATTTTSSVSFSQGPWGQGSRLGEAERLQSLATEYGLATTDIQAYLDLGYRLGDIDMALSIATQSGMALTEVIALGKAGDPASWISAGSSLGVTVTLPGKPEGAGKGQRGPRPEESLDTASTSAACDSVPAGTTVATQSGKRPSAPQMGGGSQGRPAAAGGGKH